MRAASPFLTSRSDRSRAGFWTPAITRTPHSERAGVQKAPRHEVAGSWGAAGQRALWGFDVSAELMPTACDVGSKKNSKGYKETWIGYKLHLDVACGQIPVSCVLTSASVHDSQVAIPLMTMTPARPARRRLSVATPLALHEGPKPDTITNPSLSPPGPTSTSGRSVTCSDNRLCCRASASPHVPR